MDLTAITNDVCAGGTLCPNCSGSTTVIAIVDAGQWEREFFKCRACDLHFAGSWCSTHESRTRTDRRFDQTAGAALPAARREDESEAAFSRR